MSVRNCTVVSPHLQSFQLHTRMLCRWSVENSFLCDKCHSSCEKEGKKKRNNFGSPVDSTKRLVTNSNFSTPYCQRKSLSICCNLSGYLEMEFICCLTSLTLFPFVLQMTSVERVIEYSKLEQETQSHDKTVSVPGSWPQYGIITFESFYYRHHHTMPQVLKKLNLCIRAQEKVRLFPNIFSTASCPEVS